MSIGDTSTNPVSAVRATCVLFKIFASPQLCTKMQVWMYYLDVFFFLADYFVNYYYYYFFFVFCIVTMTYRVIFLCKCCRVWVLISKRTDTVSYHHLWSTKTKTWSLWRWKRQNRDIKILYIWIGTSDQGIRIKAITNQEG